MEDRQKYNRYGLWSKRWVTALTQTQKIHKNASSQCHSKLPISDIKPTQVPGQGLMNKPPGPALGSP